MFACRFRQTSRQITTIKRQLIMVPVILNSHLGANGVPMFGGNKTILRTGEAYTPRHTSHYCRMRVQYESSFEDSSIHTLQTLKSEHFLSAAVFQFCYAECQCVIFTTFRLLTICLLCMQCRVICDSSPLDQRYEGAHTL